MVNHYKYSKKNYKNEQIYIILDLLDVFKKNKQINVNLKTFTSCNKR